MTETATRTGTLRLHLEQHGEEKPLAHDVSAMARMGETLFVAADECAGIEVLDLGADGDFAEHRRIMIDDLFKLPKAGKELDVEGLAVDEGWLWITGSHSRTREKPGKGEPWTAAALETMATLKKRPNRRFLARVPLVKLPVDGDRWGVAGLHAPADPERPAAMLPVIDGENAVSAALRKDPHIAPFMEIPAKENGLDIEGIAVDGARVALGLRGPVIHTWAVILELTVEAAGGEGGLAMTSGPVKRWLDLDGLGVRDLKRDGDDLLILAGPAVALDGPVSIWRWRGWKTDTAAPDGPFRPERVLDLPYGTACDHPEGMARMPDGSLLVVCDSPAKDRLQGDILTADLFTLPD